MSKALARFKKGDLVEFRCYQDGCKNILLPATLGEEYKIHPSFIRGRGVGRLRWALHAKARGFNIQKPFGEMDRCICKRCQTQFGKIILISNGRGRNPIIFGYGPDPA